VAAGRAVASSDVDVAVLFERGAVPDSAGRMAVIAELEAALRRDVDLVVLNDAGPILGMQVLRHGRRVLEANPRAMAAFIARMVSEYEDLKIIRRPIEHAIIHDRGVGIG
jgi:predicted nucleotidyltransferase